MGGFLWIFAFFRSFLFIAVALRDGWVGGWREGFTKDVTDVTPPPRCYWEGIEKTVRF